MPDSLGSLEEEITAAGYQLDRRYQRAGVPHTRAGRGWVVRVDGQVVATGSSIAAVEGRLRRWWKEVWEN